MVSGLVSAWQSSLLRSGKLPCRLSALDRRRDIALIGSDANAAAHAAKVSALCPCEPESYARLRSARGLGLFSDRVSLCPAPPLHFGVYGVVLVVFRLQLLIHTSHLVLQLRNARSVQELIKLCLELCQLIQVLFQLWFHRFDLLELRLTLLQSPLKRWVNTVLIIVCDGHLIGRDQRDVLNAEIMKIRFQRLKLPVNLVHERCISFEKLVQLCFQRFDVSH